MRWSILIFGGMIIVIGLIFFLLRGKDPKDSLSDEISERVPALVASEELILELTKELKKITRDLKNFSEPTSASVSLKKLVGVWTDEVDFFDSASLKIVKGEFLSEKQDDYVAEVAFQAVVRTESKKWKERYSSYRVLWSREDGHYEMADWSLIRDLDKPERSRKYFRDRLVEALPDLSTRRRVTQSEHRRALSYHYSTNKKMVPTQDFEPIAMVFKPAVSVVDVDNDGWDDIYIMVRLGENLLLHNQGDGTFVEKASDLELSFPGNSTCGIFADFDNDGDSDLMLGRSIERMIYLENTEGWFRIVEQKKTELPFLATSLAAADYNGDGLLDLYITTYRRGNLTGSIPGFVGEEGTDWCAKYLTAKEARIFRQKYQKSRQETHGGYLNQTGPPNWLLKNMGNGQFERVHSDSSISSWKNSLQGTWGDFDEDGDPDLAVANDWAVDHLFRNDGKEGFVDIASEAGLDLMGFGMGACWGDYDGDGKDDLFVTNMFSKAGQRVLGDFAEVDPRFVEAASGNFLYRQNEGKFEQLAGYGDSRIPVARSGWSWGGQFVDIDNDRDLDIHVLSGYFTAPRSFESDIDL
ncbi:VCBS repeat-containing protein [Akkermansiaceae bacterium]|nr:VCBS repeat-containing protein [Akkermansiaceae bacterium]MDB4481725.1 VCBS repeat-containing protein [Akkermansiaceae bacterium]